ncbi:MAG TPA: hypothetical protein PKD24_10445 [Pyrinomonadaceae bacterium]|nr:hypothetical protein [Pyrinomonadaceae bacterium]
MPKRFDTNPLDPEFPKKAKARTAPVGEYTAPQSPYSTAEFPKAPSSVTEDETRRFDEAQFHHQGFYGGSVAAPVYQPPVHTEYGRASDRKETRTGIPEKWLIGLPYLPFTIGWVAGLIMLFVIPKEENKVRFHAAQGFAAHIGILIVTMLLGLLSSVAGVASFGRGAFTIATSIMLIIFAIKAWQGKPVHIAAIDELTNWFEDKIGPLKT